MHLDWMKLLRNSPYVLSTLLLALLGSIATAQSSQPLKRQGSFVSIVPYAPNVVRVTIGLTADAAATAPGYGFIAQSDSAGWQHKQDAIGDIYTSDKLVVTVGADEPLHPTVNDLQLDKYFHFLSDPRVALKIETPDGKLLLKLDSWSLSRPNDGEGNAAILNDRRPSDDQFYRASAVFDAPEDERFYGLGQNQEGNLELRNHTIRCWHDYDAPGGESVCVPFMISSRGYGFVWDNPSKTTIKPGFNERTEWISEVGTRISFFVIAGATTDEIYGGYRLLTGSTPLLPKGAYGFTQSKQRYDSQDEILSVARGYRNRHLPADTIVVDFLYYTKMGQMDMDPAKWPDPEAMNRQLHQMGFNTLISIWPRFAYSSRYFNMLHDKGWLIHHADGSVYGQDPDNTVGPDIDTTNPEAAHWFWSQIRDGFIKKGFDYIWLDETEPDVPPNGSYLHIGPGTEYFNVYPLFHTASVYNGFRTDLDRRAFILARASYLGAQHNGNVFWSSDIRSTWDMFRRSIPAGLNFVASGMPYWCSDTGGFLNLPAVHHPEHPPLLDPSDARDTVYNYDDYPELYVRWFQYAAFEPIFRTHGTRTFNEPWSFGKQAEPIIAKYLRLRYRLLPYIYSLGYQSYLTGAPYMRALYMDFPSDSRVWDLKDEYMFGPAFLVAPVTEQGAVARDVYLPAGTEWYNYWTNERLHGGQTVHASAPIDTIPLFVRAGSIIPTGSEIESTSQPQSIESISVYPGANGNFTLFSDDGTSYAYEKGAGKIARLHWDDTTQQLNVTGTRTWTSPDSTLIKIIGH